jgi:hypothetical protein
LVEGVRGRTFGLKREGITEGWREKSKEEI